MTPNRARARVPGHGTRPHELIHGLVAINGQSSPRLGKLNLAAQACPSVAEASSCPVSAWLR